ncbi:MAG: hypothetical protein P9X24_11865 [Candidatus Hatepunaea meridiana]|nr:hypothetical protein [Candidatus Hatepunaea meridiana]
MDPKQIAKQLIGIGGANPVWHNGVMIRSTPDAIGHVINRNLNEKYKRQTQLILEDENEEAQPVTDQTNKPPDTLGITFVHGVKLKALCPECQVSQLIFQEGCLRCPNPECGYSKCE